MGEEPAFHENVERLRGVLDSIAEGLQVLSPAWSYLYVNPTVARHARRPATELIGNTMLECFPGIETTPMFARLERCMRDRVSDTFENEFTYASGDQAWFELRVEPCPEGIVVISLDITERKQLELVYQRTEKLAVLGQMSAGVAHNLGNILNPLALHVELLARRARGDVAISEITQRMRTVLEHGAQTISLLKTFGRNANQLSAAIDLKTVVCEAVALCELRATNQQPPVQIRLSLGDQPAVRVSAGELLTATVNLLTNSIEAMPMGGHIDVRTGSSPQGAWLEVEDTGTGMPEAVQARAFEPFFTTKGETGTGLGLASVYAFVKRHGGELHLSSTPGTGTSIRIVLPPDA